MPKFYKPQYTLSNNRVLNFVNSARGEGKTQGCLEYFTSQYKKHGHWFVYMRRTLEECKLMQNKLFNGLENRGVLKPHEFTVMGDTIYNVIPTEKSSDYVPCGYFVSLSGAGKVKGLDFAKCRWLCYDEYIPENLRYLSQELQLFQSICTTFIRLDPNKRILLLGNSISAYSPYYDEFNIQNDQDKELILRRGCLIHNYRGEGIKEEKSKMQWYQLLQETKWGKYTMDNTAIMDNKDFVEFMKRSDKIPLYNMYINELEVCIYYISMDGRYYACRGYNNTVPIYNCSKQLMAGTANQFTPLMRNKLMRMAEFSSLFFSDMQVKLAIEEFLYGSDKR